MNSNYPPKTIRLAERVPLFAPWVLLVEPVPEGLEEEIRGRKGVSVFRFNPDENGPRPDPHSIDCVCLCNPLYWEKRIGDVLGQCAEFLSLRGQLLMPIPVEWHPAEEVSSGGLPECMPARLAPVTEQLGLGVLGVWRDRTTLADVMSIPGQEGAYLYILTLTSANYNPIEHARDLQTAGQPQAALEILSAFPESSITNPDALTMVHLECQRCLESLFQKADPVKRLDHLWMAQCSYAGAMAIHPEFPPAHARLARMWHQIGVDLQATKILRNVQCSFPAEGLASQLAEYEKAGTPVARYQVIPPEWTRGDRLPRVLMVSPLYPDYGLDVLYDGLCDVLGDENVTEYPWKDILHGAEPAILKHYPSMTNRQGEPVVFDTILERIRGGYYDFVLIPNVPEHGRYLDIGEVRGIVEAARGVPIFLVDLGDDFRNNRRSVEEALGHPHIRAYFKRELLAGVDYGPDVFPLPFAYHERRIAADIDHARSQPVFWAGVRGPMRDLFLREIERVMGCKFDKSYSQSEYVATLDDSRIGINLSGGGFDTVRYWELPARGCLLLSERLPIAIPHDFEDGVSAVFADDAVEMVAALSHYLDHPDEAAAIARAGHEHLKRYHSASARARQMLGWIRQTLDT